MRNEPVNQQTNFSSTKFSYDADWLKLQPVVAQLLGQVADSLRFSDQIAVIEHKLRSYKFISPHNIPAYGRFLIILVELNNISDSCCDLLDHCPFAFLVSVHSCVLFERFLDLMAVTVKVADATRFLCPFFLLPRDDNGLGSG